MDRLRTHWCFGFGTLWGYFRLNGCPSKAPGIKHDAPGSCITGTLFCVPVPGTGAMQAPVRDAVGMWSLELFRATKRKNDPSDSPTLTVRSVEGERLGAALQDRNTESVC